MTPIDDLHVGQWIAVVGEKKEEPDCNPFSLFRPSKRDMVTGQPLQIVALSLPFIAVTDGHRRFPLDVREVEVKKLHRKYVQSMKARQKDWEPEGFAVPEPEKAKEESTGKHGLCPMCGDRLIQRKSQGDWFLACRECGFEGTLPKDH